MPTDQHSNDLPGPDADDALPAPLYVRATPQVLAYEKRQRIAEGAAIEAVETDLDRLLDADEFTRQDLTAGFALTRDCPVRDAYPYEEPLALDEIRDRRPAGPRRLDRGFTDLADPYQTLYTGWLGAVAGCLLGNPVEGWTRDRIRGFLKESGQYPVSGYLRSDVSETVATKYDIYRNVETADPAESMFVNDIDTVPSDDDIDYLLLNLAVVDEHGISFRPVDVADRWLRSLPVLGTYTAERVAYRNLVTQVMPPESGRRHNPYREHVGAMIRGDIWGYLSVGAPERAAELAWRDASISHRKNGIYGAMWIAAMAAAAPFVSDPVALVNVGLSEVPATSRLADELTDVLRWYANDVGYEQAVNRVHERWDETDEFEWVHTLSNAQILSIGLLWGDGAFEPAVRRAVQAGFDTDSHGATLGSLTGLMAGADGLPDRWVEPLNDRVGTGVAGTSPRRISTLADRTLDLTCDQPP